MRGVSNTALIVESDLIFHTTDENMNHITELLENARTIAVYGMSDRPFRDSNSIGKLLMNLGYTVYPVNPTIDTVEGQKSWPDLKSLPESVDIVDVFRNPAHAKEVVLDAIEAGAKAVWFQLGAEDEEAEQMARDAGLDVISGHCIAVELRRRGVKVEAVHSGR